MKTKPLSSGTPTPTFPLAMGRGEKGAGSRRRVGADATRRSMRRRLLIAVAGALTAPFTAHAQQQPMRVPRVGYLIGQLPDLFYEAFQARLAELGYVDGKNVAIDRLNMEGRLDRAEKLVLELSERKPNVIVLPNVASMNAARKLALSLPYVVHSSVDPVEAGFAASLSRPGGNFTGIASLQRDLSAKRLEVVQELMPKMSRLAVLWDATGPGPKVAAAAYEAAAQRLKWSFQSLAIRDPKADLEGAFEAAIAKKAEAIVIVGNPLFNAHRAAIAALVARYRVPSIGESEYWASSGVLFTLGPNIPDIARRMAYFVHRILQGAKPGDLPFEQPTKFDLILNMKTAKSLGITIPQSVLVRADRVIE